MCAAKNENIITFLNRRGILWQPIALTYKDPNNHDEGKKKPIAFPDGTLAKADDMMMKEEGPDGVERRAPNLKVGREEVKRRQKKNTDSEYIAIYTEEVQQVDIDKPKYVLPESVKHLEDCPYFKSNTKQLPHYFVKINGESANRHIFDGGDLLTGQWAYARRDAAVFNNDKEFVSFNVSDFIPAKVVKKPVVKKKDQ